MEITNVLSGEAKEAIALALRENSEIVIRDMASSVSAQVRTRRDHPSFGNTKTAIRASLDRMEGAIGLYMVQHGQATHTSVTSLAEFLDEATTTRVRAARNDVKSL